MNRTSIIGILLGLTAVFGGNLLEGGKIGSVVQGSAALIVFGGTLGATFLSFSVKDIKLAARTVKDVFYVNGLLPEMNFIIADIVTLAGKARRDGFLALDNDMKNINYLFFRRAVRLVIDGLDPKLLQNALEQEIRTFEEERYRAVKVFEAAGGFAPTIGIIGAVLGLIHVMENLSDPTMLGSGIAIAFVATIYGVASANLIFLPIAKKLANNVEHEIFIREMIIDGVLGIQSGQNPFYLREQLSSFLSRKQ
ncbi:chemotaxis protein PomA [bacterium BMS3Bbin05]|nr:chemotaxis protein PomA [bacterium BMS3Bbin05]